MGYKVSEEKKKQWRDAAIQNQNKVRELIQNVSENFTNSPEQIAEMMAFSAKFYKYSINNCELIYGQNPNAVFVQSYEAWKKMDAHVQQGAHGMKIWVPVKVTILFPEDSDPVMLSEATEEQKRDFEQGRIHAEKKIRFKVGTVFDVSQTDYPKENLPKLLYMGNQSEEKAAISRGLTRFCENHDCKVFREDLTSVSLRGYYDPRDRHISMNHLLEDTEYLSTLSHEMGHMLQEHGTKDASLSQKEFEADCISVVIQSCFGVELTDSRKRHLADHYRKFLQEIKGADPNLTKEDCIKRVEQVMDASLKVYRQFAEEMVSLVDEELVAIHKERDLDQVITQSLESPKEEKALIADSYSYHVYEFLWEPSKGKTYHNIENAEDAIQIYQEITKEKQVISSDHQLSLSQTGGVWLVKKDIAGSEIKMVSLYGNKIYLSNGLGDLPLPPSVTDSKMVEDFCKKAKDAGFPVLGSCTLHDGKTFFLTDEPKDYAAKEETRNAVSNTAIRRHRGR